MTLASSRVLVTGADGFIGSHLVERLVRQVARVRALAAYNSFNSWGWLDDSTCLDDIDVVSGDIRDASFCRHLVEGVDVVFHLAALIAIPFSYRAPGSYVETNIGGTLNLCEAARAAGVQRFIHTSTSEVYGTAQYVPIDERHPLNAQSPYSATKIGADAIALSFFRSFNLPVVVARPFNTYGPRQSARAVIPTIISQLASGVERIQIGDLTPTRDFTFVEDTCDGFVALADMEGGAGEVYNIGSGHEIAIGDLVSLIGEIAGAKPTTVTDQARLRPALSEVQRLWCDATKLKTATGFAPKVPLRDGLRRTFDWFSDPVNLARYKTRLYNV